MENLHSANKDIFYGTADDLTGDDKEQVEVSALALHLIQAAIGYLNTILIQAVLRDPAWRDRLTDTGPRGLFALFWTHLNLYGRFELDMNTHLDLGSEQTQANATPGIPLALTILLFHEPMARRTAAGRSAISSDAISLVQASVA